MELTDVKAREIKEVQVSTDLFNGFKDSIEKYTEHGADGNMAFVIEDKDIIDMWSKHIKPYSDKLDPLVNEMLKLEEERAAMEKTYAEVIERCEAKKKEIETINLKRNKFITRVSPIIIRKYGDKLNEFQQFGSIIEDNGKVFVTVKDWLASFISGFKKKADAHKEKVTDKIIQPKMQTAE